MQLPSDPSFISAVHIPNYVEVLRRGNYDRSTSLPSCFLSRYAVEGSADEMLVALAAHHWVRNCGQLEKDGTILAHVSRHNQLIYQITVASNILSIQNGSGKQVLVGSYIPNIKVLRVIRSALSPDDIVNLSGMIMRIFASTTQKRKEWRSGQPTTGFVNARYTTRRG
jgi:hypothetical protein